VTCHEGAHLVLAKHSDLFDGKRDCEVLEEGTAQIISNTYMEQFYPHLIGKLERTLRGMETDNTHMQAFQLAFGKDPMLYGIIDEIRRRNSR